MTDVSSRQVFGLSLALVVMGAGWGLTQPLTKIAVSTGYQHFGLIFWQFAIGAAFIAPMCWLRGVGLPRGAAQWAVCLMVALVGTIVPNSASYQAAVHLPSGVLSLLLSMVPMWAFPIALAMGNDRFSWRRFFGLGFGLCGVFLIIAPGAQAMNLPVFWLLIGLISGMCYGLEGNLVARFGTAGMQAFEVLYGACVLGTVLILPVALLSGQFVPPQAAATPEGLAHVGASVIHVLVYTMYVWMVGRAGPVFAVQVSYLVTGFGVLWAMVLLGEAYAPGIWAAMALMFVGMYLVQPRSKATLAPA